MRIAIVMTHAKVHNHTGGATKLFFDMASELHSRGYTVDCYYSDTSDGKPIFGNPDGYQLINLKFSPNSQEKLIIKLWRKLYRLPSKLKLLKVKADPLRTFNQKGIAQCLKGYNDISHYDLYIAFGYMDVLSIYYAGVSLDKTLTMCHTAPSRVIPSISDFEKKCWFSAKTIHCLLPSYKNHFQGVSKDRLVNIPNPVAIHGKKANLSNKRMTYLARVERNKRQHLIVEAINKIDRAILKGWEVNLFGSFPSKGYKKEVESLIQKYSLEHIIKLKGVTEKPVNELLNTSINLFPSAFEGFPLGLTEAMSLGIPSVGYVDCSGVNELIIDSKNGYLANNIDDFSNKINLLIESEKLRVELGREAFNSVEQYAEKNVWDQWDKLIRTLIH